MRRREISPDFWSDERVFRLGNDAARLLLPGLYNIADREGRLVDKPFEIGVQIRPWAPLEVVELLNLVVAGGLIVRYEVDGVWLLAFDPTSWRKYQRPHPNEAPSKLPPIPAEALENSKRYTDRITKVIPQEHHGDPNSRGNTGLGDPDSRQAFHAVVPSSRRAVVPSGSSTTSAGEPAEKAEGIKNSRAPSEAEDLVRWLEDARIERCEELDLEPGPREKMHPARVNKTIGELVEAGHEIGTIVNVHKIYLSKPFGQFKNGRDGELRSPPWPLALFLSRGVFDSCSKDYDLEIDREIEERARA